MKNVVSNSTIRYLMRLSFLTSCMAVISLSVWAKNLEGQSLQKTVAVKTGSSTLTTVLKQLARQTHYRLVFDESATNRYQYTSLESYGTAENLLDSLLANTTLGYREKNDLLIVYKKDEQEFGLKGKVIDGDTKEPLLGVTIAIKGTRKGVVTAPDGGFSIASVKPGDILVVSYIGYENKEVVISGNSFLTIPLGSSRSKIKDVVVVGYGVQKKVNLTGAVAQVDASVIESRPVANVGQALQGAVPNLNVNFGDGRPGSTATLNIRGFTSISGGGPLILIDGIPGDINTVNPRDIESITVLKDAASAAIYGARGAFGVVLLTTKKGKAGKMQISYGSNYSWSKQTTRTDFITSGYDAAMLNDEAFKISLGKTYTGYTDEDYEELLKRKTDPTLPSVVIQNRKGKDMYVYYGNTDWWKTMFRDVMPSMEHSLNISGGNDKINYMVSGRAYQKKGMMRIQQDKYNSYNFRAKVEAEVKPWLVLSSNTQLNAYEYTYPGLGVNDNFVSVSVHALPSYVPVNPDGTATYRTELNNYTIGDGIYADLLHGKSKGGMKQLELVNSIAATFKITPDINIIGNYTLTVANGSSFHRQTAAPWSIYPGVISYVYNDNLWQQNNNKTTNVVNIYGNYNKRVGKHNLSFTAGVNQELQQLRMLYSQRNDILSEDLNEVALGSGDATVNSNNEELALLGAFGRAAYSYADKYLVEFNGRYDGSSRFPSSSRFGFFPSVSTGWRMSEEAFFAPVKNVISDIKWRASYGALGNQDVKNNYYPYIPLMSIGTNTYVTSGKRTQYVSLPTPITADLTWEKVNSTNFGVDLAFLRNKLNVTFDWYIRNTKDMLTKGMTLPAAYGATEPKMNAADLRSTGWEINLDWRNSVTVGRKALNYNIGVNVGDFKAEITKFDNPNRILSDYYVGKQLGEIWGYSILGYFADDKEAADWKVDQTQVGNNIFSAPGEWGKLRAGDLKFADLDNNGAINKGQNTVDKPGDQRVIGNSLPRYTFGIRGGADWNGFDFSLFFQGIGRQHWYPGNNADKFWGPFSRPYMSFIPQDFPEKLWSEENPNAYFPRLRGYIALNDNGSLKENNDRYLQDLAYIRLKSLILGYSLPASLLQHLKLTRCRIYFSGENLLTLTKLKSKYLDPEQLSSDPNLVRTDANGRVYPFSKTYAVGVDISF
ncbi:TonB-dependent receptor [Chitinophaga sp. sic0106]|uniref:SusC/RagA family TonB-linked outer membrane protein n=1 Tax=Chitinophaga sp. sic0106 TaxID=2854785 RepID=UPI001C467ACA|nr:TonB-dependent receptor [Chitinophaga sp. sic0106]MBV7532106.1 TonB-dependent receptor [Chitinophaga sp. sic0106]